MGTQIRLLLWEQSDLDPPCFLLYLNLSVLLGNYLQRTTSARHFSDAFFLGDLRVNQVLPFAFNTFANRADQGQAALIRNYSVCL